MANYNGVVKWFDNEKGYGFIKTIDGERCLCIILI